jgi:hypothetical protein
VGNSGNINRKLAEHLGITIARKYQIKEIYWEDNNISETSKWRNYIWTELDKSRGDVKYSCCKEREKERMDIIDGKIQEITKEGEWPKVLHKLNKDKFQEYHLNKNGINMRWCTLCNQYRAQVLRLKKPYENVRMDEIFYGIRGMRRRYTNKKRLTNKMEIFWKKKKAKLRELDWFTENNIEVQEKTEENKKWLAELKRLYTSEGGTKTKYKLKKMWSKGIQNEDETMKELQD